MFNLNKNAFAAFTAVAALAMPVIPAFAADEDVIEEIVVTGSRIKRSDYDSASPVTIITGQSLRDAGMLNLGEALRNQPSIGTGGFNQSSILNGSGATSIDLRNLGADRVLILINGRRVASFADSLANQAADLTFVPTAMVDRVEILRDGASAVYGSDAITGVVNVILKKDFEGAELKISTGSTSESDGDTYEVALTVGVNGDRGSMIFGAEVREQEAIKQVDRDWAFPSISSLSSTGFNHGSFFSPGGVFFGDLGAIFCTRAKALGGDEVTDVFGTVGCESFSSPSTRDEVTRYDYGFQQDLIIDSKVISASAYGNYEVTDDVNVFVEMQFAKRTSIGHLDGNPGSFGTVAYPDGSLVPATNPNNPTGEDGIFFFRPTSTIGPRTSFHESNTYRFVMGVDGGIPEEFWFNDGWDYELSALYTKVDADLQTRSTWNLARFIRISDPDKCVVDDLCSQVVNPSGALDTFRPGNWTQAEITYMRQNTLAISKFQTHGWTAIISGPLFELPAGEVGMAAGLEYRKEEGLNQPDPTTEAGESVANAVFRTDGNFTVEEFFVEVDVPILADVMLAENLSLNLQYRQSDYSNFGSEDVYRVGLNWQIIPDLRVRANVSTAYRAPTITDLFGGGTVSFDFFDDPCQDAVGNAVANCALDGLGAGFTQISSQYPVLAGSNANLEPETADTFTFGIVYTPGWLEGFRLSADLWDIEVEDLVSRPSSSGVLTDCYEGPVGLTDPTCSQFEGRNPGTGVPINFINKLANLDQGVKTDGFDLAASYLFEGFSGTSWNIELVGTYVAENTFSPGAGGADDRGSIPRVVANLSTSVAWNNWDFTWYAKYISGMDDPRFDGNNPFGYSGTGSYDKHDLRVSYEWERYRILLGVNNVLDDDPPYLFSSGNNTDVNLYDVRGQYWFVRFDANFF